jgi:predicted nucleic acid-binding protein
MYLKEVVIDASPLITLFKSQQAYLLNQLFSQILVPEAVWNEVIKNKYDDLASQGIVNVNWLKKVRVNKIPEVITQRDLGKGESEVLTFALNHPTIRAMLDDHAARQCAKSLGIPTLGTGGMLILAKQRGILLSVTEALEKLRAAGMWISDDLFKLLTAKVGE